MHLWSNKSTAALVSKMDIKADKVGEASAGVAVTNATTTMPVDLAVMVEEAVAVVVVGSEAAVEVIRTGIPRGCGIEMFYLFDSFTQFSVQSGEEETFAEAVRSIVGAFAQVKYVKQGIAFSRVLLFVRFLYRPTITTFLTSEKPNDRNNIV